MMYGHPDHNHAEALQPESPVVTCRGCIHLTEQQDNVGWCTFHWQYRSISLERTCKGAPYFDREA